MAPIHALVLLSLSVRRASSKVCASDAEYVGSLQLRQGRVGSAAMTMPGDRCLELKQWWRPCEQEDYMTGGRRLADANSSDEVEDPSLPHEGYRTCDEWLAMVDDRSTAETCFDSLILSTAPWGWYPVVRHQWLAMLQPCCGDTPHACAQHSVNPCEDEGSFRPQEKADNYSNTCALSAYALSQLGPRNSTQALCSAKLTWGAQAERTVYSFVEQIARPCCRGRSICADHNPSEDAAARSAASLLALLALAASRPGVRFA